MITEELLEWAQQYVPIFNKLATAYNTSFYTQSPLSAVNGKVDLMIIGINPKGSLGEEKKLVSPEMYLEGNPYWKNRFLDDGTMHPDWEKKSRFLSGTHFFLGYDNNYHPESIDNDKKTVWTNLSPFDSGQGSKDLPKELMSVGIESTMNLISILQPKRIVILGTNAFQKLKDNITKEAKDSISYIKVFDNIPYCIGRIDGIPTVNVCHPSGQWKVSNKFTSVFILLHYLTELAKSELANNSLEESAKAIRKELKFYKERVEI